MIKIGHEGRRLEGVLSKIYSSFILILIPLLAFGISTQFQDNYTVVKWLILYVFTGVISLSFVFKETFYFPRFRLVDALVLFLLAVLFCVSLLSHNSAFFFQKLLDYLTFLALLYVFFNKMIQDSHFIEKVNWMNLLTSTLCTLAGFVQLFGNKFLNTNAQGVSSFFGNPNMVAQFIGVGLISNIFLLKFKNKTNLYLLIPLTFLSTYLVALNCRSVLLAISICILFLLKEKKLKKSIVFSLLIAFVLGNILPFKHAHSSKDTSKFVTSMTTNMPLRGGSIKERLEMWKGTIFLLKENPFMGIGPGEFEFDFIPFQKKYTESQTTEKMMFNTPHNEFLRIAAEYGVPFLLLCLLIFLYMFKNLSCSRKNKDDQYIKVLAIFFIIEGVFQFPLLNSFSFFYISLITSYLIYRNFQANESQLSFVKRFYLLLIALLLIFLSNIKLISSYLEVNYSSYSHVSVACDIFPSNWRACLTKSQLEMQEGNFNKALKTVHSVLDESPFNFSALHVASFLYWKIGNKEKSCEFSKRYIDLIDSKKNSLFVFHIKNCSSL